MRLYPANRQFVCAVGLPNRTLDFVFRVEFLGNGRRIRGRNRLYGPRVFVAAWGRRKCAHTRRTCRSSVRQATRTKRFTIFQAEILANWRRIRGRKRLTIPELFWPRGGVEKALVLGEQAVRLCGRFTERND